MLSSLLLGLLGFFLWYQVFASHIINGAPAQKDDDDEVVLRATDIIREAQEREQQEQKTMQPPVVTSQQQSEEAERETTATFNNIGAGSKEQKLTTILVLRNLAEVEKANAPRTSYNQIMPLTRIPDEKEFENIKNWPKAIEDLKREVDISKKDVAQANPELYNVFPIITKIAKLEKKITLMIKHYYISNPQPNKGYELHLYSLYHSVQERVAQLRSLLMKDIKQKKVEKFNSVISGVKGSFYQLSQQIENSVTQPDSIQDFEGLINETFQDRQENAAKSLAAAGFGMASITMLKVYIRFVSDSLTNISKNITKISKTNLTTKVIEDAHMDIEISKFNLQKDYFIKSIFNIQEAKEIYKGFWILLHNLDIKIQKIKILENIKIIEATIRDLKKIDSSIGTLNQDIKETFTKAMYEIKESLNSLVNNQLNILLINNELSVHRTLIDINTINIDSSPEKQKFLDSCKIKLDDKDAIEVISNLIQDRKLNQIANISDIKKIFIDINKLHNLFFKLNIVANMATANENEKAIEEGVNEDIKDDFNISSATNERNEEITNKIIKESAKSEEFTVGLPANSIGDISEDQDIKFFNSAEASKVNESFEGHRQEFPNLDVIFNVNNVSTHIFSGKFFEYE